MLPLKYHINCQYQQLCILCSLISLNIQ